VGDLQSEILMDTMPDLKKVEIDSFRLMFLSDGLIDIYLGLALIPYIVWIYSDWAGSMVLNGVVFLLDYPVLLFLKRRVIMPRVGMIKPGPIRRRKMKFLVFPTILGVLVTIAMIIFTGLAGGEANRLVAGIPIVFWAFGLATVAAATAVSWLLDWPRLMAYGLLVAVTIPVDEVYFLRTGRVPLTVTPMMVMVGMGLFLLIEFLRRYPEQRIDALA
jgi:peptidoglycan/LPS O-acetylase OafA/YrhL